MALPQAAAHTPGQLFAERHWARSIHELGDNTAFDSAVAQGEAALSAVGHALRAHPEPSGHSGASDSGLLLL